MLSLIIPVRDRPAEQIDACVASFLRLGSKSLSEIIIVDFGSIDAVVGHPSDRRVRVVRIDAPEWNLGEAINVGIAESRHPIVAKADGALVIAAECGPSLDAMAEACRRARALTFVQTIDLADGIDAEEALAAPTAELLGKGHSRARGGESGLAIFPVALWSSVGGFDPRCDGWDEVDTDFANRVRRSGHKVRRRPTDEMSVFHVGPSTRDTAPGAAGTTRAKKRESVLRDRSVLRSIALPAARSSGLASPNIATNPQPLVTVAIASTPRNGRDWILAGAIRSFAGQIGNDFEVLIANAGPTDGLAAELLLTMPINETPKIRAFDVGECSIATARNCLTDEARGRYICIADDNSIALPNRLADHLRCFQEQPDIHGSHGGWIDVDQSYRTFNFNDGGDRTLDALLLAPGKVTAHTASLFRKDVLQAIRYDEAVLTGPEVDLALRMANLGCVIPHTGSYLTVRRSQGGMVGAESLARERHADDTARQRVGETRGKRNEPLPDKQAKSVEPAASGKPLTKDQVVALIDGCSGPARLPGEPVISPVVRHARGKPLVSVVITCFNYGRYIAEAVASVKAQTFENIEIILVDGGSTDGKTPAVVAGFDDGTVRVFCRDEPHRAGNNRNFGIERARGRYICCLDADDMLAPTYIEKAVFLLEHYGYDIVSSGVQQFGKETTAFGVAEKVDLDILLAHNQMATCGVFRKSLWQASGGYVDHGDGSASTHVHDDWQFWVRLAALGARFFNLERDHLFLYRIHGPSVSHRPGVQPLDWQRRRIREMNAELITDAAIERSIGLRRIPVTASGPLTNLVPAGRAAAKSIVVAVPYLILGGAERLLSKVLKHLAQDGWDISIVTTVKADSAHGDAEDWFSPATNRIYHLPDFLARERWDDFLEYLVTARRTSRLLIAGSTYAYGQLPSLKEKHPHLKVFDLLFNTTGHTKSNRQAAEYLDGNIVENAEVRDWLLELGERPERIATIPSGVDLAPLSAPVGRSLRRSIGAKARDIIVGFSGRWSPEKNPVGFVQIAERLSADRHIHFVMTGAGPLGDEISARLATAPRPARRFHLLGNVENLDTVLASLDILALPSNFDGRPMIVLEALAAGVPVVASRVGGVPELILPGINGELCPPGDIDAFAATIAELAADPSRLARYKVGARSFAEEHLDERWMLERYAQVLGSGKCKSSAPATARVAAGKQRVARAAPKAARAQRPGAANGALRTTGGVAQ